MQAGHWQRAMFRTDRRILPDRIIDASPNLRRAMQRCDERLRKEEGRLLRLDVRKTRTLIENKRSDKGSLRMQDNTQQYEAEKARKITTSVILNMEEYVMNQR